MSICIGHIHTTQHTRWKRFLQLFSLSAGFCNLSNSPQAISITKDHIAIQSLHSPFPLCWWSKSDLFSAGTEDSLYLRTQQRNGSKVLAGSHTSSHRAQSGYRQSLEGSHCLKFCMSVARVGSDARLTLTGLFTHLFSIYWERVGCWTELV